MFFGGRASPPGVVERVNDLFSWKVLCLLSLLLIGAASSSVTLASGDYSILLLIGATCVVAFAVLSYLWWKALGLIARVAGSALAIIMLLSFLKTSFGLTF